ncbi:hypothetical protein DFP72DRAFT_926148 [Ephemerocybe angulata]|uniref:MYND-type domain-containing protein n=1 Tax=Ephemerocybe angulata TaxID=980116 RepID=A0A8H6HEB2_9AGAR|nr:hypothetical protein DFP72DRAFT_926148 [Tulosesus angulatus]
MECRRDLRRARKGGDGVGESKECAGCKGFVYCGEACQREGWGAGHKGECAYARVDMMVGLVCWSVRARVN